MRAPWYRVGLLWMIFFASAAAAVFSPHHVYTFLTGMSFGCAQFASLLCWKWGR